MRHITSISSLQLFKGRFYYCEGPDVHEIKNKTDCLNKGPPYRWVNRKYNFDNLGQVSLGQNDFFIIAIFCSLLPLIFFISTCPHVSGNFIVLLFSSRLSWLCLSWLLRMVGSTLCTQVWMLLMWMSR